MNAPVGTDAGPSEGSDHESAAGRRRKRRWPWVLLAFAVVLGLVVGAVGLWLITPLPTEQSPLAEVRANAAVEVTETDTAIVMRPAGGDQGGDNQAGGNPAVDAQVGSDQAGGDQARPTATPSRALLFFPGARVEAEAYLWTLSPLVEQGVSVVVAKPRFGLALLDSRGLSTWTEAAPEVSEWVVGGHSMGGVKACAVAKDNPGRVTGLFLAGSYCAEDLSARTDLAVLSVGGSRDGLSTPQKIADNAHLLPSDATFVEIEGMNHAQFGAYGEQSGDEAPQISDAEARAGLTAPWVPGDLGLTEPAQ
ncbi:MAG: alpha/beta hydrolase [Dermabacter sp.]|nr:alpha/beta hydrolase [Dermabacter sp.]